jgi:hypothetical protein
LGAVCYQALAELLPACNPTRTQWVPTGPVLPSFPRYHPRGTGFSPLGTGRSWLAVPSAQSPPTPPACGLPRRVLRASGREARARAPLAGAPPRARAEQPVFLGHGDDDGSPRHAVLALGIACEKRPKRSSPTRVAPFSRAAFLAPASSEGGLVFVSSLKVLIAAKIKCRCCKASGCPTPRRLRRMARVAPFQYQGRPRDIEAGNWGVYHVLGGCYVRRASRWRTGTAATVDKS